MKKVLLVSHDLTITGAPLSLKGIASILNEDHKLTFWSMKDGPLRNVLEKDLNIYPEIVTNDETDNFVKIAKAMSQFDFVIVNTIVCNRFANICEDFNIPYVWIIREAQNIPDYQIIYPELFKTIKRCKNNLYVVSEYAAKYLQDLLNIKVMVIHNFVNDEYKNKKIKLYNKINFTFVGTIQKIKGIDILVEALNQLPEKYKDLYSLSILGENVDKQYQDELNKKQNNNPSVNCCGVVIGEERQKIFEETNVFVVPSLYESSSRVTLEACMMGRPVIVTENVGAKYMVNEKTGWIVKAGDTESLKICIENILENPQILPDMGKAAREMYLKTSTPEIYKKNLYKIISTLPKKATYSPLKIFLLKIFSIHYLSKYKLTYVMGFKIKQKYNLHHNEKFWQKIFSIKNHDIHKVFTIMGIKIKIPYKKLISRVNENFLIEINKKKQENQLLKKFVPKSFLDYVEIHLVEHCNLNCASCTHFCPLAEEYYLDIETFTKDLNRLADLTNRRVGKIRLMGGEPLLHPELNKFMGKAREIFPNTNLSIVTNGILLNKQNQDFWNCCRENNILITISGYPIKLDYDFIKNKAKENNVHLSIPKIQNSKAEFWHWVMDLNGKQNPIDSFKRCYHANKCIFLKNGKLYTCPIIPNICNFNKYFNKNLEVTPLDFIDIYKTENIMEILNFLAKPVPFCRYCDIQHMTWHNTWKVSEKSIKEWT